MRIYIAFDDTDVIDCGRGTGKLARWFEERLPHGVSMTGVIRHQLLVADDIPYTSHNSSLCLVAEAPSPDVIPEIIERAAKHIKEHFFEGSDPGLCVAGESDPALNALLDFSKTCLQRKVSQAEAMKAAAGIHLSGHGGTDDGIIGAAAAVGLTHHGMSGRFIECGGRPLRDYPLAVSAGELVKNGLIPVSVGRNSELPADDALIHNGGWLRPRLFTGKAVVPVCRDKKSGEWYCTGKVIYDEKE